MIYLLDTNTISDLLQDHSKVWSHFNDRKVVGDTIAICFPVQYELMRGLLWKNARKKLKLLSRICSRNL